MNTDYRREHSVRRRLSAGLDKLLFWLLRPTLPLRTGGQNSDRVILGFFVAHLGDFVILLDSLRAYRKLYPGKKLVLLCTKSNDMRVLARHTGVVDEVIVVEDAWSRRIGTLWKLMKLSCDTVINVHTSRTVHGDLYIMAVRANRRIAAQSDLTMISPRWLKRSDALYSRIIPCDGIGTMELIRNAQYVRGQGAEDFQAELPKIPAAAHTVEAPGGYFVVCPGADGQAKRWPAENFVRCIDHVLRQTELSCRIIGVSAESPLAEQIRAASEYPERIDNIAGKTTLMEYIAEIRNAEFLLSSDTSAGHIAPAVDTPAIVIGSGWDRGRFFPYCTERAREGAVMPCCPEPPLACLGCGRRPMGDKKSACIEKETMRCVSAVTAERVMDALDVLLRFLHAEQENEGWRT